ncbi:5'-3' exonuclease PLD3 isoform X2 [Hypomesus transpacificus]|uniref:5'-3' exonuclease PLD3 isoform X2 n=1 Tax=Hypomesus transpacificus TaxID=137520 RepID=UPI001F082D1C|nr:5'-3' exonuclease PLD3 isoform X2 [Hypomesus transpacificus]
MPMELRTRSLQRNRSPARRSTRHRSGFPRLEDSESFQDQVSDSDSDNDSRSPQVQEEGRESVSQEATGLKDCAVVLNRLNPEDEEKEDLIRKSGKQPVSRIPTFQSTLAKKKTTGGIEPTTPSFTKKEAQNQMSQLTGKASSSGDISKSKLPNMRETALIPPSMLAATAQHPTSSLGQTIPSGDVPTPALPKKQSPYLLTEEASEELHFMTVDPRPALRSESGDYVPDLPDEAQYSMTHYTNERLPFQTAPKDTEEDSKAQVMSRAENIEHLEMSDANEEDQTDLNIDENVGDCDELPPCKVDGSLDIEFVLKDCASDSACLDESVIKKPSVESFSVPEMTRETQKQPANHGNVSETPCTDITGILSAAGKTSAPRKAQTSGCWSFLLFCLLPSTLLLVGGFGQHVWHYGPPSSVSHLVAQLQLHWLEGFLMSQEVCSTDCRVRLVESIPQGLYPSESSTRLPSIYNTWIDLLKKANRSVDIAAFYVTLRDTDQGFIEPTASQGKDVFKELMQLQSRGLKLQIAVNGPESSSQDTSDLSATGAEVREVDLNSITGGIVHTKLWVVDQKHLYLGSANMDWRSLTQVKEVGIAVEDCSCLAQDASRIFGIYWSIGAQKHGFLPPYWPARYSALSSAEQPLTLKLNGVPAQVYLSSAPPQISARGRADDLSAILSVIADAQKFVYISVMDFLPLSEFTKPIRFWPAIDSAIRASACTKGVEVNLLVSCWAHSRSSMFVFLQSLTVLNTPPLKCNINVKVFEVPSTSEQKKIPFARVNHAKYMVTDRVVYIGTSNWSENYFTQTAGVGLVVNHTGSGMSEGQSTLQSQLQEVFQRDWTSENARHLSNDDVKNCGRR